MRHAVAARHADVAAEVLIGHSCGLQRFLDAHGQSPLAAPGLVKP